MTEAEKALQTVRISEDGLPREWLPLKIAREMRQRALRDSRIYRDYLAADDPNAVVLLLADRWGLQPGHVTAIIEKQERNGVIPAMAAEIEVLRQTKRRQILEDGEEYRAELAAQIVDLEEKREGGLVWIDVEQQEDDSEKFGATVKTKRVKVTTAIKNLKNELAKSHELEASAIERYIPKQVQTVNLNINKRASDEFVEQFDRMAGFTKVEPVATDITNNSLKGEES